MVSETEFQHLFWWLCETLDEGLTQKTRGRLAVGTGYVVGNNVAGAAVISCEIRAATGTPRSPACTAAKSAANTAVFDADDSVFTTGGSWRRPICSNKLVMF